MSAEHDQQFRLPLRVYIEDTDAGGIVYYVNYLKFMERARTEFMRSRGFGKQFIFNQELMFVVRRVAVDYLGPARLDDELTVTARILKLGGANLVFAQSVTCGEKVLCEGEVTIVCVDKSTVKPKRIPQQMRAALTAATNPA